MVVGAEIQIFIVMGHQGIINIDLLRLIQHGTVHIIDGLFLVVRI